mmetsp:Transcript_107624/g.190397  ORF Transcript_107624/g.190397 Transcript_107624/m.190397 type:complete len:171 (-) Transcript_107624:1059-1571(-)
MKLYPLEESRLDTTTADAWPLDMAVWTLDSPSSVANSPFDGVHHCWLHFFDVTQLVPDENSVQSHDLQPNTGVKGLLHSCFVLYFVHANHSSKYYTVFQELLLHSFFVMRSIHQSAFEQDSAFHCSKQNANLQCCWQSFFVTIPLGRYIGSRHSTNLATVDAAIHQNVEH